MTPLTRRDFLASTAHLALLACRSRPAEPTEADSDSADLCRLDDDASSWGVYAEGQPRAALANVSSPSLDGRALRCALLGGAPYSNAHFYRNLPFRNADRFTLALGFQVPPTSYGNEGGPSLIQALEFTMNKWQSGIRHEWALQWEVVADAPGASVPDWRYWDPERPPGGRWVGLDIRSALQGDLWHRLTLSGAIAGGRVVYDSFRIDDVFYPLGRTAGVARTSGEPDRLAVAVQLDGNSVTSPYAVHLDDVCLHIHALEG